MDKNYAIGYVNALIHNCICAGNEIMEWLNAETGWTEEEVNHFYYEVMGLDMQNQDSPSAWFKAQYMKRGK